MQIVNYLNNFKKKIKIKKKNYYRKYNNKKRVQNKKIKKYRFKIKKKK